jgi:hypothetical protein
VIQRPITAVLVSTTLLAGAILVAGCGGSSRSVSAYCKTFYGQGSALRQQWLQADQQTSADPLDALGQIFAAPQELANFFNRLDAVAPSDIEPDVKLIGQTFSAEASSLSSGNVIQSLASGLVSSVTSEGAFNAVNQWTLTNCGPPPTS